MYANNKMLLHLISLLKQFGIKKVVVSPGCRHIPFVHSLEQDKYFELFSVVDERSAAFFAMGLIQQSNEPVAVACTSGTACQNFGSAVVESFYQKLPLLLLSGDRLDAYINQNEDQSYDQVKSFKHCTKYTTKLPYVQSDVDEWHCNRLINEALNELTIHGRGPVHISFPIVDFIGNYTVANLPVARKISWHVATASPEQWGAIADRLRGKKIAIVVGQSVLFDDKLTKSIDNFCLNFDAIVLTDKIANCHCQNAISNTWVLLNTMNADDKAQFKPDVLMKIGGVNLFNPAIKNWLVGKTTHWQIGELGKVCDEYHVLSDVYEMPEWFFFEQITENATFENSGNYAESWKLLSQLPVIPQTKDTNAIHAIGQLLAQLPNSSVLQLANSMSIRYADLFNIDPSIKVYCNRGTSGIDGSLSTAVGYASVHSKPLYYITGDLSFFYDMNALSIKHLSNKIRILLINNSGGAVLLQPGRVQVPVGQPINCAANNNVEAKRWVESCGFKYISAHSVEEINLGISQLLDEELDQPIMLEVFTDLIDDASELYTYFSTEANKRKAEIKMSFVERAKRKGVKLIKQKLPKEKIEAIKILLK